MGLNEGGGGMYLKVSYGAIRKTCQEGDPKAVSRVTKDGATVWERVWRNLTGRLIGLTTHEHEKYGRSWTLHVEDNGEVFQLQVSEDSKYGSDLLKKIPNLVIGKTYKFNPYDFTPQGEKKARTGLSIVDEETGGKIQSYFHKIEGEGKNATVTYLNGYPEADPNITKDWDKDDWKIYFMKANKVMRGVAVKHVHNPEPLEAPKEAPADDDIEPDMPF